MRPLFSNRFVLLQQEGYLIQSCLGIGLTQLRNTTVNDKGGFYGAFFNLSIGIERLLKAILLIDYFLSNRFSFPSQKELKTFGHDLCHLYQEVGEACERRVISADLSASSDAINQRILRCLSDFALRTRYSNLNNLQSGNRVEDPLSIWFEILRAIYAREVSRPAKDLVNRQAYGLGPLLAKSGTIMNAAGMHGEELDLSSAFLMSGTIASKLSDSIQICFS